MAALIRCYELGLLCDGTLLEELLAVSFHEIREEFLRLWLDDSILNATKRNDYEKFESLVSLYGKQFLEDEIINGRTYEKALKNMREIYMRVKGD